MIVAATAADAIAAAAVTGIAAATVRAAASATVIPTAPNRPARAAHQVTLEHRLTTLDSGVRIVTERMPSVRSVSLGFWIGTGSRGESEAEAGLSHLLEHLLFKGASKYSSLEIDQIFDGMGAEINAGTGKETTSVYARVIDEHLPKAFDVITDMVFRPTLADIDSEREVILEEIAMYEDDPQEKIFDVLGGVVFPGHPLGRAIIGHASVIADTPADQIARFHASRYTPGNVVIAAAGAVDHEELVALATSQIPSDIAGGGAGGRNIAPPSVPAATTVSSGRRFERKDTEQFHVCVGAPGLSRHDDRRFALRVLDTIFGGTSSSRLFQAVRERHGLAYSVYSFTSAYEDTGQVGLYVGTRGDNLAEAMRVVDVELARLRTEPATAEELVRAKENLKGRVLLALESTGARMSRLGSELLAGAPLLGLDDVVAKIDAVTLADLEELAAELWDPSRLSIAGIGPDEKRFGEALAAADAVPAT
ncbi:MAG TPA: pitrilysin family protein [Solirubrobacteraceae bacterium]|nr:pitrilysin family protein [Solirubrobacteraceae bacterium]